MKKSTLFLTGMAALLLSFGLILTGCSTDADDPNNPDNGGSTLQLSHFDGEYYFVERDDHDNISRENPLTVNGTNGTLTVGEKIISDVTTAAGDHFGDMGGRYNTWVYLVAGGNKIGLAVSASDGSKDIRLGIRAADCVKTIAAAAATW
jgi:hypothetical protein